MTPIAPHIAAFLNERLPLERRALYNYQRQSRVLVKTLVAG